MASPPVWRQTSSWSIPASDSLQGIQSVTLTTNDVNTWYDAMQLELRRRFSGGLLLQLNYTWSKSLTNFYASSQSSVGQPLTLRDANRGA